MLLARIGKFNYLVKLLLLLAAIFVLVLAVFLLATSFPESLGTPPPTYQIKRSYEFEPWSFSFYDLHLSFPEGGIIVPVYEQEKQKAALILGREIYEDKNGLELPGVDGNQSLVPDPESLSVNSMEYPEGIFLMITEEELEKIKKDIIFIPVEDPEIDAAVNDLFNRQPGLPVIWSNKIPFSFPPSKSASYYYFIDQQGDPVWPPVQNQAGGPVYISGLLYIMFYLIIWLVVLILSLDHRYSSHWKERQNTLAGGWELGAVLVTGAMAFGGEILPGTARLPEAVLSIGYGAAIFLLFALLKAGKINHLELGIDRGTFKRGYFIAIMAAVMLLTTILRLPQGIRLEGRHTIAIFITIFFCLGLSREMLWRGFIQNILGRQLGPAGGLLATALLAGAIRAGTYFVTAPWMLSYPFTYVEIIVLEPGLAAILGFLYFRTENVLSCALLHTLVIFLPQTLMF